MLTAATCTTRRQCGVAAVLKDVERVTAPSWSRAAVSGAPRIARICRATFAVQVDPMGLVDAMPPGGDGCFCGHITRKSTFPRLVCLSLTSVGILAAGPRGSNALARRKDKPQLDEIESGVG